MDQEYKQWIGGADIGKMFGSLYLSTIVKTFVK